MPANQKELSPQISPEFLESPDQRPRSSSLNSLVSDVSVAGSEAVLETSSEGDSNAVFVQSAQNSILPKPPTPTVAPMMSSPVSNIFLPIKDLGSGSGINPEEEINIPSQDPTLEDLNAQELFKNIAQLTLSAQESIDFSGTFKSAVNKERLSNVGKSVMDMTKSKKLEFFKALSNSTGNNQTTNPNQVNVQGTTISPKAQPKEPPKMQTNLNLNNKSGNNVEFNSKPTASERVAVIPPADLDINTNVNLLNLTTKNGNAIQPSVVSCTRPLSPKYDIPFPEDLPPKTPSPRPQTKTPSPRPHLKKQIPPPRPPPISVPRSIDRNQDHLPKSELIQTQDSSSKSTKNEFDNRPKLNSYNQIEDPIVPSSPSTVVERYSDKVYSDKVPIITQQSSITVEDIGTPPSTPLSKQALDSSLVKPSVQQIQSKHSKAKESTTSRFLGTVFFAVRALIS